MNYYREHEVYENVVFCNERSYNKNRKKSSAQKFLNKFKNDPKWQKAYIEKIEQDIEEITEKMIDERFVDYIFDGNKTTVN